jgi:hypothetical protein
MGLHLAAREGKQAKNRAVVAMARKLAVLLPRIWTTQEPTCPSMRKLRENCSLACCDDAVFR